MTADSVAFVGVVGGVGTTRTVLELAGALAGDGREALVFDLDFPTEGLSRFVDDRIETDTAAILTDPTTELTAAVHDVPVAGEGRLGVVPAFAPLTTLGDAMAPDAGERVGDRLEAAGKSFDHVLLDVPPVVTNQAIGGVVAADRSVAVVSPTDRGMDALPRERGRLADLGTEFDSVLAVGDADGMPPDVDAAIPAIPEGISGHRPASLETTGQFADAVRAVAEELFSVSLLDEGKSHTGVVASIKRQFSS